MSVFTFKQFTVQQKNSSHKVGTDGVLLGAWTKNYISSDIANILDIGTGTGVISLMMAQAFATAVITAIEPDTLSAQEASENFLASPWSDRLHLLSYRLEDYQPPNPFQLIICNPPFYIEDTYSPDRRRASARHISNLSLENLFKFSSQNLKAGGYLSIILPSYHLSNIINLAAENDLHIARNTFIYPKSSKDAKRILLMLTHTKANTISNNLTIYHEDNTYTSAYIELCKDYYLKM